MNIKPMLAMCNSGRRGEALSLFNCGKRNVSDSVLRAGVTDHGHGSLRGGSHRGTGRTRGNLRHQSSLSSLGALPPLPLLRERTLHV